MYVLAEELFPFPRSITGDGVRATLDVIDREIGIDRIEVPSGTAVLDWTVPDEWNVRGGWIRSSDGSTLVDFADSNLHVLGYSEPVSATLTGAELRTHLHTLPDQPDLVPYRTSYYQRRWGFCMSDRLGATIRDDERYEVLIDSTLEPGHLSYGEHVVPGHTDDVVLISTHVCHPSLANDNLSGIVAALDLARHVATRPSRYTYVFLFIPGTIGSITWLAGNAERAARVRHGLVLTGLGDRGPITYKQSRQGTAEIDRVVAHVLASRNEAHEVQAFSPYGYDERQFCSPGFDLPVGRLSRSPHGTFPEYHTSADNLAFITPESLAASVDVLTEVLDALDGLGVYRNLAPFGEPQLGRRGLYRSIGASMDSASTEMALLWVLNMSDGSRSVLDIAERSGLGFGSVREATGLLLEAGLLEEVGSDAG
ncbi:MAG TPA: DUF4910 domain-containing protein [Acidimicrobiales bacterium]|jgi:aminopeptidase-like protein